MVRIALFFRFVGKSDRLKNRDDPPNVHPDIAQRRADVTQDRGYGIAGLIVQGVFGGHPGRSMRLSGEFPVVTFAQGASGLGCLAPRTLIGAPDPKHSWPSTRWLSRKMVCRQRRQSQSGRVKRTNRLHSGQRKVSGCASGILLKSI